MTNTTKQRPMDQETFDMLTRCIVLLLEMVWKDQEAKAKAAAAAADGQSASPEQTARKARPRPKKGGAQPL